MDAGPKASVLIVGGNSTVARELDALLGNRSAVISRRPGPGNIRTVVAGYEHIPEEAFDGIETVINCVGTASGSVADLERVNVLVPLKIAETALAHNVRHFIQLSSFSVYGRAERIARNIAAAPVVAYGRSKLAADLGLQELAANASRRDFGVTILRLPMIYAQQDLGKLGALLKLWNRIRILPIPQADVARSMISARMVAQVVQRLIACPRFGVTFAADPDPFSYRRSVASRPDDRLGVFALPRIMTRVVRRVLPGLGERLFADSLLADEDNLAIEYGIKSTLYHDIAQFGPAAE